MKVNRYKIWSLSTRDKEFSVESVVSDGAVGIIGLGRCLVRTKMNGVVPVDLCTRHISTAERKCPNQICDRFLNASFWPRSSYCNVASVNSIADDKLFFVFRSVPKKAQSAAKKLLGNWGLLSLNSNFGIT